ncbi:nitroreductase family protein [Desulfovibrio ferrophilus]|uniref:Nitroreductase n=1 Tax=Desulfovibrio ferrophilus TaxID=241368 RepID=A0A2Z6B3H1_9BACT|nr:nitroreductase [Desulfovibrio ferrophilus]BBD09960.1 nitroreductase [Desulfovibrio ferrophilus]
MSQNDHPILRCLFERRSVRKYTDEPIVREDILSILEAGRWAPSGLNNQPWRFMVISRGDERVESLAGCTKYGTIVRAAGALIGVFLDKEAMYSELKDHQTAGACIQNMMLAAHALGLGSVWLGEIVNQAPQVLDVLSLDPAAYECMAIIAVGHPAHPGASSRKPLSELMLEDF